jgi:hypothetical protein
MSWGLDATGWRKPNPIENRRHRYSTRPINIFRLNESREYASFLVKGFLHRRHPRSNRVFACLERPTWCPDFLLHFRLSHRIDIDKKMGIIFANETPRFLSATICSVLEMRAEKKGSCMKKSVKRYLFSLFMELL